MADNVDYTPGSGATIAADEVDGVLYQRIKLVQGIDGVAVDVSADTPLAVEIKQNFETNGALVIKQDDHEQFRTLVQARGSDGFVRDLALNPRGELLASVPDNVTYNTSYTGTPVANTVVLGPYPAEGFASASMYTSAAPSAGFSLQVSPDGLTWLGIPTQNSTGAGMGNAATAQYASGILYTGSIPACMFVRVILNASGALSNAKYILNLSKVSRVDFVQTKIVDLPTYDNVTQPNYLTLQNLLVGGVDALKRTRPFAVDGTVNPKSQGSQNQGAGTSPATPYYGHVMTTAIIRLAPYTYNVDQPAALQSNTRGELQVDQQETRRMLEQQLLVQQAASMQLLDPNWGFELR